MKVKELQSTVNVVWSPASYSPVLLATGSAAQHVDSSFSSSAALEMYSLNLGDPGYDMEQKISIKNEHVNKFQKLVWSAGGVLVGGCDGGLLRFYNVNSLLEKKEFVIPNPHSNKHNGPVSALDLNPFQNNLLASGASDSEIYIWDLNNLATPMAPGNKAQPFENVQALAWNRQVQHILASTFSSRCVVWDLRKNEPIIKLSDGQARTRWHAAAWHPSVATQLCIASEDDQNPVIQLWDLRLATSPLLSLEGHHKGVLGLSWCSQDPDLMLSSGKDGRVLCWNPNSTKIGGEILLEVCSTGQWMYDVAWCPKNPNLIATCSNDGRVGIYSINGGTKHQQVATTNKIMDSFPGMESLHQAPVPSHVEVEQSVQVLPRPPLWTKRPIKASFGFGGKLITFDKQEPAVVGQNGVNPPRQIYISQVTTEPELVAQAQVLQEVIAGAAAGAGGELLAEHCRQKAELASDQHQKYVWHFLKASFQQDPRSEMLNLLGFRHDDLNSKVNEHVAKLNAKNHQNNIDRHMDQITDGIAALSRGGDGTAAFDSIAQTNKINNIKADSKPFIIPTGDDPEGVICQALLSGNIEAAVELCLEAGKTADALVIASTGGADLLARTQWRHISAGSGAISRLSSALLGGTWDSLADSVAPSGWKAALAAALTHCTADQLYSVCESLGKKLSEESDVSLSADAVICYLCSVSLEPLVACWQQQTSSKATSAKSLTQVVELVLVARLAALQRGRPVEAFGKLSHLLTSYALRLASQGYLEGALNCLSGLQDQELTYRLQCALGYAQPYGNTGRQNTQRPSLGQNQWSGGAGSRVRTSSYKSATQPQESWGSSVPQASYMPSKVTQNPLYNTGMDNHLPPMPAPASFPAAPQVQAPLQQPPRPTSASSHGGITAGRNKYVRDPSVQSGMGSYGMNPVDTQPGFGNRPSLMQPSNPTFQPSYNSPPNTFNPAPFNPPPFNPPSFNPMQPADFSQPKGPPIPPSYPGVMNPADTMQNGGGGYPGNAEVGVDSLQYNSVQAAPGWNDPPMISSSHKPQAKQEFSQASPITHPLYGSAPPPQAPLPPQYPADPYSQQQQQPLGYGTMPPSSNMQAMPTMNNHQQSPAEVAPPPAPVQKAPIPEQHIHMQTVFDALRAQCSQSAHTPQNKRKLEEVQKKLETLYDLLRENRLSENATTSLHYVVQLVQSGNYEGALSALSALAASPDFSYVSSFLPSLKVMIQIAVNSQIYLR